jgi:hypothetical protein
MRHQSRKLSIGGKWRCGDRQEVFPTLGPDNGEVPAEIACGIPENVNQAVEAAMD